MTKITASDIQHLAGLSKLALDEQEVAKMQQDIEAILGFIDQLQAADVEGLEPTDQVTGLTNVTRRDELDSSLPKPERIVEDLDMQDNQFKVPKVL